MVKFKNLFFTLPFSLFALFTDQISKFLARNLLATYPRGLNIIGDFLRFHLTFNPYAVFSISLKLKELYYILPIIGIVVIFFLSLKTEVKIHQIAYGLILGGALGNIIDRIKMGKVTDFIDIGIGNLRWPTFNLADVFIVFGIGILLFFGKKKKC